MKIYSSPKFPLRVLEISFLPSSDLSRSAIEFSISSSSVIKPLREFDVIALEPRHLPAIERINVIYIVVVGG